VNSQINFIQLLQQPIFILPIELLKFFEDLLLVIEFGSVVIFIIVLAIILIIFFELLIMLLAIRQFFVGINLAIAKQN